MPAPALGVVVVKALPGILTGLAALTSSIKGFFGAVAQDSPLTAKQIQLAKTAEAAIKVAGSPAQEYTADQTTLITSVLLPGFNSLCTMATSGATKNTIIGALFHLISQEQQWCTTHNIPTTGNAPVVTPDKAQGPVDIALAEALAFAQSLTTTT